jgi:BirA family biotin operon repressor/biotin-[acetyl-CoA-carboxylase] ligase
MEIAHELAAQGTPDGTLVFAARQEQGRGRLGRTWVSPEGGAYCSIMLRPTRSPAEIPQLSLVAGLATAEAIRELTGLSPSIRWPNDVLINDLKVAGILVEARNNAVVVGIGINVTTDPADLPPNSTSLQRCLTPSQKVSDTFPVEIAGQVYRRVLAWYDVWSRSGFAPIREALRPWIGFFGQPVHLTAGTEWFEGTASDLDEQGRLLVRLDSGLSRAFDVGEVALLRARA